MLQGSDAMIGALFSLFGSLILFGIFYGTTRNRLNTVEDDLKLVKNDKLIIIDKLARIETKLDYLTKKSDTNE